MNFHKADRLLGSFAIFVGRTAIGVGVGVLILCGWVYCGGSF